MSAAPALFQFHEQFVSMAADSLTALVNGDILNMVEYPVNQGSYE